MNTLRFQITLVVCSFGLVAIQSLFGQSPHVTPVDPNTSINIAVPNLASFCGGQCVGVCQSTMLDQTGRKPIFNSNDCENTGWFFRSGPGTVIFGESARIESPTGTIIANASATASENTTFLFDIGYQLSPQWSVTLTAGIPPETTVTATGPLADQVIGTARYAPAVLALQRHFPIGPCSTFYVGGGVNYTIFYETKDGLVTDLHINNAVEGVAQIGLERRLSENLGLFADVKKIWLDTTADGLVGTAPSIVRLKLNPTVLNFGITYRF